MLQLGAVVYLSMGGQLMTVTGINGSTITCQWNGVGIASSSVPASFGVQTGTFNSGQLTVLQA